MAFSEGLGAFLLLKLLVYSRIEVCYSEVNEEEHQFYMLFVKLLLHFAIHLWPFQGFHLLLVNSYPYLSSERPATPLHNRQ